MKGSASSGRELVDALWCCTMCQDYDISQHLCCQAMKYFDKGLLDVKESFILGKVTLSVCLVNDAPLVRWPTQCVL